MCFALRREHGATGEPLQGDTPKLTPAGSPERTGGASALPTSPATSQARPGRHPWPGRDGPDHAVCGTLARRIERCRP